MAPKQLPESCDMAVGGGHCGGAGSGSCSLRTAGANWRLPTRPAQSHARPRVASLTAQSATNGTLLGVDPGEPKLTFAISHATD